MELVNVALTTFAAALIAQVMMPGSPALGIGLSGALGFAALVIATVVGREFGWFGTDELAGFVGTLVAALVMVALYRMFSPSDRRVRRLRARRPLETQHTDAANDALGGIERSRGVRE